VDADRNAAGNGNGWNPGRVVVTGGASGLGRAVAGAVARAGGTPVILDRSPTPEGFEGETVDLADGRAAEAAVERIAAQPGGLDAVVACAGTDACGPLSGIAADDWERVIKVNLLGTAAVVRAALPSLMANNGKVVTVASTLGLRALPDASAYCASKFGVVGLTRALAAELAGQVGVTLLIPGGMATAFFDGRDEQYKPPADAKLNDPDAVAATILFALSQPPGCEVRELVVCPSLESSWP
jgi:NAD(P)-dependent dehydrogenase (short-subunit alcohol dehydrogenase family)